MADEGKKDVTTGKSQEIQKATPARSLSPFEEMDRLFESFFPRGWLRPMRWEWPELGASFEVRTPRVDVIDREAEVVVRAEVPGVDKKDIEVSVTENTVTIQGSSRREEKEERDNYYRREIMRGAFSRTVALPAEVDSGKAKATFKDGVLELTVPKVEKAKRRSVPIE